MKKIEYYKVNPGGNSTAIVPGPFSVADRKKIALSILKKDTSIEQVGYWTKNVKYKNSKAKLTMAGGEFCGNATRALAILLGKKGQFRIEVSGISKPVDVWATQKQVSITIPLGSFSTKNNVCRLPGITHLLVERNLTREQCKTLLRKKNLLKQKAAGVIGYKKISRNKYEIYPVVWVRDIKTLFSETACASGTMALALTLFKKEGLTSVRIKQPSRAIFTSKIDKRGLTISGPFAKAIKQSVSIT